MDVKVGDIWSLNNLIVMKITRVENGMYSSILEKDITDLIEFKAGTVWHIEKDIKLLLKNFKKVSSNKRNHLPGWW